MEKIKYNELISKRHKKTCRNSNYVEHLLIFVLTSTGCVSISSFAYLFGILVGITSSVATVKICVITPAIKKYKWITKKKKKKHDKIVLLAKAKLDTFEVLISKALIDSYISHDKVVSVNVWREYNEMKEEIKKLELLIHYTNMGDTSREIYERNGVETIIDSDAILWLNEKHIKEELDHKNFTVDKCLQ